MMAEKAASGFVPTCRRAASMHGGARAGNGNRLSRPGPRAPG
jgi:hypothetical protein